MRSLPQNHIDNQNKHFQSIRSNRRRKQRKVFALEAEISINSDPDEYVWIVVIRRNGRRIDQLFGKLFRNDGKSSERTWLFAAGMAFEWRDRYSPGSRLLFRESAQRKRR
jgi:hypothetical protein